MAWGLLQLAAMVAACEGTQPGPPTTLDAL
jgi:hypothetical protein